MKKWNRQIALILCAAVLLGGLTGCGLLDGDEEESPDGDEEETAAPSPTSVLTVSESVGDGIFSILYSADHTLNPYTSGSRDNLAVGGLIYEGLYALDDEFAATEVLCERITTVDGVSYTLEIKSGVTFHNGGEMTVEDVLYSLELARSSSLYGDRLSCVYEAYQPLDSDGEAVPDTIEITLNKVHGNLPVLLTFPIIQQGSVDWSTPPGTGPYMSGTRDGSPCLEPFGDYWDEGEVPVDVIYLRDTATMEQLTAEFNSGVLDIVALDLTETGAPNFSGNKDIRPYDTTLMDYVGFNIWREETGKIEVRQAISYAIDRDYVMKNIMAVSDIAMGSATALPLHPALSYYDNELAQEYAYDLDKALQILDGEITLDEPETGGDGGEDGEDGGQPSDEPVESRAPTETTEEDAEAPDGDGGQADDDDGDDDDEDEEKIELTLLVCSDNTTRMQVAVYIAQCVSSLGYKVSVDARSYDEYITALENGDYDMFYGQVRLQPDFDLTQVLVGELAYGGIGSLVDRTVIDDFLAAGAGAKAEAARAMCEEILYQAPIAVVGFRHLSVVIQHGTITGMNPTQDNIYHDILDWTVDIK